MIIFTVKELESSTETNSYCTIVADNIPNNIDEVFSQNPYLYSFGVSTFWQILSHDEKNISWTIGMESVVMSCNHVIQYLHQQHSDLISLEIINTIM